MLPKKPLNDIFTAMGGALAKIAGPADFAAGDEQSLVDAYGLSQADQSRAVFLPRLRSAIARLRAGMETDVRALFLGDSNTVGYGAFGAAFSKAGSYPTILASLLTASGLPARESSVMGSNISDGMTTADLVAYDPRLAITGGGSVTIETPPSLGGNYIYRATAGAIISFTPIQYFDRVEVYCVAGNPVSVSVTTGGVVGATPASGSPVPAKTAFNVTRQIGTISLTGTGAGNYILGIRAWDSTSREISIINAGKGGITSAGVDNADIYGSLAGISVVAPHVTFVVLGINDAAQGVPVATYKAHIENIVARAQQTGDVVLVSFIPFDNANYATLGFGYVGAMREISAAQRCLFIDATTRFVDFANVVALGFSRDALHPNAAGYTDYAAMLCGQIRKYV